MLNKRNGYVWSKYTWMFPPTSSLRNWLYIMILISRAAFGILNHTVKRCEFTLFCSWQLHCWQTYINCCTMPHNILPSIYRAVIFSKPPSIFISSGPQLLFKRIWRTRTKMPFPNIPVHSVEEMFPKILPDRPSKKRSCFSRFIRNGSVHIAVAALVAFCLVIVAVTIGTQLGRNHHTPGKDSVTASAIGGTKTVYVTNTEVTTVPLTIAMDSQSTTFVTLTVPQATPTLAKCAGGAFSHPECQVD